MRVNAAAAFISLFYYCILQTPRDSSHKTMFSDGQSMASGSGLRVRHGRHGATDGAQEEAVLPHRACSSKGSIRHDVLCVMLCERVL